MRLLVATALVVFSLPSFAHPGNLDKNGCHKQSSDGSYHCHREEPPATPKVKLSSSGLCHERDTQYYAQTKNYTAFKSMKACIKAGGRQPDPKVKLSKSGICHERGSQYYERTKDYTGFKSMKACKKAGGREPK